MKKLMIIASVAALTAFAFGDTTKNDEIWLNLTTNTEWSVIQNYANALTTLEWKSFADAIIEQAQSNTNILSKSDRIMYFFGTPWKKTAATTLASEYDVKFANAGFVADPCRYSLLPLCCEKYLLTANGQKLLQNCPTYVAVLRKYGNSEFWKVCTPEEAINIGAEMIAYGYTACSPDVEAKKRMMVKSAQKVVKHAIRANGKSFAVGTAGAVQLQNALKQFVFIIDSPKMTGLDTWMGEWAPAYQWNAINSWLTNEEVQSTVNAVLNGDRELYKGTAMRLCGTMGVSTYNNFINTFNGD